MTGPQRNAETSQHQFTSALCWITEEESVEEERKGGKYKNVQTKRIQVIAEY